MKKKNNKELSAEIKVDGSTQDEAALSVCRYNTKPDVTCSQSQPSNEYKMYVLDSVNIAKYKKWLLLNN